MRGTLTFHNRKNTHKKKRTRAMRNESSQLKNHNEFTSFANITTHSITNSTKKKESIKQKTQLKVY